ncbi:MAG: Acetyltransferase (GNAT) family protein [Tenericutes bacterium ADurb.BinA155]|nr:MAG: Acetyltransferase (GNAT) family protein [Tenericutes bacterium ADurb.BinA155]
MSFQIRPYVKDKDEEAWAYIRAKTWQTAYEGLLPPAVLEQVDIEQSLRILDHIPYEIIMAYDGDSPAGYIVFTEQSTTDPSKAEILSLNVLMEYENQGIGTALCLEALSHHQTRKFRLEVLEGDTAGISFFQKQGFVLTGNKRIIPFLPTYALEVLEMTQKP